LHHQKKMSLLSLQGLGVLCEGTPSEFGGRKGSNEGVALGREACRGDVGGTRVNMAGHFSGKQLAPRARGKSGPCQG